MLKEDFRFRRFFLHVLLNDSRISKSPFGRRAHRVIPLLVAMMRIGAMSLSSARFRYEKHSMSNMCTSSMNKTCTMERDTVTTLISFVVLCFGSR